MTIPDLTTKSVKLYDGNVFETDAATTAYLAQHPNAPVKTLGEILLTGKVVPARARVMMGLVGRSTSEAGYLDLLLLKEQVQQTVLAAMANEKLDALVYATFDYPPQPIPADALTRTVIDSAGPGNNRRLSPVLGFPAMTVPAGFTAGGLPVGLESWGAVSPNPSCSGSRTRTSRARTIASRRRRRPRCAPASSARESGCGGWTRPLPALPACPPAAVLLARLPPVYPRGRCACASSSSSGSVCESERHASVMLWP